MQISFVCLLINDFKALMSKFSLGFKGIEKGTTVPFAAFTEWANKKSHGLNTMASSPIDRIVLQTTYKP